MSKKRKVRKKTSAKISLHRSQPAAKEIIGLGERLENGDVLLDFAKLNRFLSVADVTPIYTYERAPDPPYGVVCTVPMLHETLFGERKLARAPRDEGFSKFVRSLVGSFVQKKRLPDESLLAPVGNITENFLRTGELAINTGDYVLLNQYYRQKTAGRRRK